MYYLKRFSFDNVIPNEMFVDHDFLGLVIFRVGHFTIFAPNKLQLFISTRKPI
jgi:hypothetical protein